MMPQPHKKIFTSHGELKIWLVRFSEWSRHFKGPQRLLSLGEKERCAKFKNEHLKARYEAAHSIKRLIIGNELNISPRQVLFKTERFGKPEINDGIKSDAKFNLSHSNDFFAFSFSREHLIGIDIEDSSSSDAHCDSIVEMALNSHESSFVRSQPIGLRGRTALALWTRKEALLKGDGRGLGVEPSSVDVVTKCEDELGFLLPAVEILNADGKIWEVRNLSDPDHRFVAHIAFRPKERSIPIDLLAHQDEL